MNLNPPTIVVGDVDSDGVADRAVLERVEHRSAVRLALSTGRGAQRFSLPDDSLTIAALDLDNDNDLDIVVVSTAGRVTVFYKTIGNIALTRFAGGGRSTA